MDKMDSKTADSHKILRINKSPRIIFLGSGNFGGEVLLALIKAGKNVVCVVTGTLKPGSRGKIETPLIVKVASEHNIPHLECAKVSDEKSLEVLKKHKPDLFVTASFGQMLKQGFLDIAPTLNVHGSLLPKYRGASPVQSAIINGETKTGITIMQTVLSLDAGDIGIVKEVEIGSNDTAGDLFKKMAVAGGEALVLAVDALESDGLKLVSQSKFGEATFCKTLKKEDAKINWALPAHKIKNFVRGLNPWPVAWFGANRNVYKVYECEVFDSVDILQGKILISNKQILIGCGNATAVSIKKIQAENGKVLEAAAFLNGNRLPDEVDS